ncbi:hypothetical protein AcV5_003484 [Taiwanofungus camphoratus]|nr:hypothetical protein AcV5_003484 [Antrodia cinnamomea]
MTAANPVFKFNREVYMVKVDNIPESVSHREILELFNALIGEIRKYEEVVDGSRRVLGLTFQTHDAAKKALCMSGYNVAGVPLAVTVSSPSEFLRIGKQRKQPDNRRNLYVLGLPFDLSKSEFVEIFSRYGTVSHAVILATVDNASRRRGFIVMSNHHEAQSAMDALSRTEVKGYTIDVSWAVVQRSQGFLDGGDRTTVLAVNSPSPSPSPLEFGSLDSAPSSGEVSVASTPAPPCILPPQVASLLVKNLPAMLFSHLTDLYPLFGPFGEIKKIDVLEPGHLHPGNVSVTVEYATVAQAKDARDALHGQLYSHVPVEVEFLQVSSQSMLRPTVSGGDNMKTGLNPHAVPFVIPAGPPLDAALAPGASFCAEPNIQKTHIPSAMPKGLSSLKKNYQLQHVTPASLYTHIYVPITGTIRPNSAPSLYVKGRPYIVY